MNRFKVLALAAVVGLLASVAMAAETTGTAVGGVAVLGYTVDFGMALSWLFVPLACIVTELAPARYNIRPLIPFVFGAVAGLTGHFVFGLDVETAQAQCLGAMAAGNMSGLMKLTLPMILAKIRPKS